MPQALAAVEHLTVAVDNNTLITFMGATVNRLEMLFVAPNARGAGVDKWLLTHGIHTYGVCEVTANEQNPQAVGAFTCTSVLRPTSAPKPTSKAAPIRYRI